MELRILLGNYKNRAIKILPGVGIRPTLVRARRVLFDTLQYYLGTEFSMLDAFAGSGVIGIEALSRGATNVIFFDINRKIIKMIESNLREMRNITGMYLTHTASALTPPKGQPVDVIYLDPPYEQSFILPKVIKKLNKYNWIHPETIIVIEIPSDFHKEKTMQYFNCYFKESIISNSRLLFFKACILLENDFFLNKEEIQEEEKEEGNSVALNS